MKRSVPFVNAINSGLTTQTLQKIFSTLQGKALLRNTMF